MAFDWDQYFRYVYQDKKHKINFEKLMVQNVDDTKAIFNQYDNNNNGYIEYAELEALFTDIRLREVYAKNFDEFMSEQFAKYDVNGDGVISFEEFIHIHNNLLDQH